MTINNHLLSFIPYTYCLPSSTPHVQSHLVAAPRSPSPGRSGGEPGSRGRQSIDQSGSNLILSSALLNVLHFDQSHARTAVVPDTDNLKIQYLRTVLPSASLLSSRKKSIAQLNIVHSEHHRTTLCSMTIDRRCTVSRHREIGENRSAGRRPTRKSQSVRESAGGRPARKRCPSSFFCTLERSFELEHSFERSLKCSFERCF
jgi:hypothetical protein